MRIGIDARMVGSMSVRGIGRYTQEVVDHCSSQGQGHQFVIITTPDAPFKDSDNVQVVRTTIPWYSFREQTELPRLLRRLKLDLVHFPHFNVPVLYRRPYVVTVHDLILRRYPSIKATTRSPLLFWLKYLFYRVVLWNALKNARAIVTISIFSRDEIQKYYPFTRGRINVLYEGVSFDPDSTPLDARDDLPRPYILYVGSAYPHKNLDFLMTNFQEWNERYPEYHLVVVGKRDVFANRLENLTKARRMRNIHFLGGLSDIELSFVYRNAHAFVIPSLYEGFGLPPLEAMAYGIPVLSSDRASLPEVLGKAALYFSPEDGPRFKNRLTMIVSDEKIRSDLTRRGKEQASLYSWTRMGRSLVALYESLRD